MADPFSIAASCVGLLSAIATATVRINGFVRTARDTRGDLDAVSRELSSLRTVLELIQADAEGSQEQLPQAIVRHLCEVLTNCNGAVSDIEKILRKYENTGAMTSSRWALSGKGDVDKLRAHLEAHTSALGLVLDMMSLVVTIKIKHDTSAIHAHTTDIKADTANILLKIDQLQARLPSGGAQEQDDYMLQRYLEEMTTYTEGMLSSVEPDHNRDTESGDDEMAALEQFLGGTQASSENPATSDIVSTPSVTTTGQIVHPSPVPVPQSSIHPQSTGRENYALFSGNLVIDIPLPQEVLAKFPHGAKDEFSHVRYTAVTCEPRFLKEKGYLLRSGLFSAPRTTDVLLSIHYLAGTADDLFNILSKVWDAVDQLPYEFGKRQTLGYSSTRWKGAVFHLHIPRRLTQSTVMLLNEIAARPTTYDDPRPRTTLSDKANGASTLHFDETSVVNGEPVLWQMYEYTTQLRLKQLPIYDNSGRRVGYKYTSFSGRTPLQTIITHGSEGSPYPGTNPLNPWKDTLSTNLGAKVTVCGGNLDAERYLRPWSLAKAWRNKPYGRYEVTLGDLWDWSDRWNDIKARLSP
ncbi:chitin synthase N-terminal-domain-containing protein [Cercophora newfieldiana]|uniref:chitin synthase n=1 Tax=Cercophora newfieldiana TaxID=92897 RepID=A0AA40CGY6_9PEZI|nr:chitin synthase N-terminal-domain-containing protein [Cercophora newfieldiana]